MSQRKIIEPEENTVHTGRRVRDLGNTDCCVPVSMFWAQREGKGVSVGYRHTGFLCAGEFVEMPHNRWRRTTFHRQGKR